MNLKILSFNVRYRDDSNGHSIIERGPRILEILQTANADLMGFQEYTPQMKDVLAEKLSWDYEVFDKFRSEKADTDWESAPIFWKKERFDCIDKGYFWLSDTPNVESKGWDELYDCYRICMWVVLKDKQTAKEFIYMNTHFGFGNKGQCDSVRLMKKYASKIGDLPAVFTGDFNLKPETEPYTVMVEDFYDVNKATVCDRRFTYHGYSIQPKEGQEHIDYCFVNDGVIPKGFEIITKTFDGKFASDHYAILAEIEI